MQFPRDFARFIPFISIGLKLGFDESAAQVPELLPFFGIGGVTHIANPLIGSLAVTKRDRITSPFLLILYDYGFSLEFTSKRQTIHAWFLHECRT